MLIICAMHNCHEIISGNIREVFGYIAVLETNLKPNFMILSSVIKRLTVSTASTTSGKTDITSGQASAANRQMNGKASTTSEQTSNPSG